MKSNKMSGVPMLANIEIILSQYRWIMIAQYWMSHHSFNVKYTYPTLSQYWKSKFKEY